VKALSSVLGKFGKKQVAIVAALVIAGGCGAYFVQFKKAAPAVSVGDEHASHAEHSQGHSEGHGEGHGEEHANTQAKAHAAAHVEEAESEETHVSHGSGFFARFADAFESIQGKIDGIRRLDLENSKLKLENAQLRVRLETSVFQCTTDGSKQITEKVGAATRDTTGSKVGRTLASIGYKIPSHLLPDQLHALGVSYLKAREFEKAAVIFTMLGQLPKDESFKTPAHKVLTGLTWYRLKNWDMADLYFDQVLQMEGDAVLQYQAQSRLWKALIAHNRGVPAKEQFWLQELVDYHPQSPEAFWINPRGASGGRLPAHAQSGHKKATEGAAEHHRETQAETQAETQGETQAETQGETQAETQAETPKGHHE